MSQSNDTTAAVDYLCRQGAGRKLFLALYEWRRTRPGDPLRFERRMAIKLACKLVEFDYLVWRARMAVSMWITR